MTREEFIAGADWAWVRAGVAEHRADCEMRIAQVTAEIRATAGSGSRLRQQEELARMQANIDAADHLLATLDRQGV
jgi:hypothetical protein